MNSGNDHGSAMRPQSRISIKVREASMLPLQAGYTSASVSAQPKQKISCKAEGSIYVHVITPTTPEFKMFTSMRFKTPVIDDVLSSNIDAMLEDKLLDLFK
ncbi:hypothetical protein RSP822_03680, partial [Ralstonia solanacearum]